MNQNIKLALIIGGIIVAILIVLPPILGLFSGWPAVNWGMMGGFGMGWFMPIFMIIFWGLIIWGIVALIRGLTSGSDTSKQTDSALEVLKRRYARGDINKQEYEEKKKDLTE